MGLSGAPLCNGWLQSRPEATSTLSAMASSPGRVATVEIHGLTATEEVVGTVRTRLHATVEAKVVGRIESLTVAPGQTVRQGQVLATLDARETQARLDSTKAVLDQAARDLERMARLLKDGAATPPS